MLNKISTLLLALGLISNFASAQFSLTLNFSEMDPHIGQRLEVRITEVATAEEVARELLEVIPAAEFTMNFVCLRHGRSYFVDFFVDFNKNGHYDAPPVDHVWRVTLNNVTSDQVVNFVHNTNFTDVGWPGTPFLSYLEAVWGGKWENLTFGSTDSIQVQILLVCDSFFVDVETKGLFGNPEVVMFNLGVELANGYSSFATDTLTFAVDAPLAGELVLFNGQIYGDFVHPLLGFGLQFHGNFAAGGLMALYTVTDATGTEFANGYFYAMSLDVVDARSGVRLSLVSSDSASCSGIPDGSATVMGSGGFPPYNYLWSDGGMGAVRDSLSAGTYGVSVTDQNGCEDTLVVLIETSINVTLEVVGVVDLSCFGAMDGQVTVAGAGGTPPYTYLWDDGRTNPVHDLLSSGTYSVTTTDANGCQSVASISVNEPDPIVLDSIAVTQPANGESNGAISIIVTGGTMPYVFSWTKDNVFFTNDQDLTDIPAGTYVLSIEDANGCMFTSEAIVVLPTTGIREINRPFNIYPNPANTFLKIEADFNWRLKLVDLTGREIANWESGTQGDNISLSGIDSGMYFMVVYNDEEQSVIKLVIHNY